jgi:D-alanine-D-alanine ligase
MTKQQVQNALIDMVAASAMGESYIAMVCSRGVPKIAGSRDPRNCRNHFSAWCVPYVHVIKPEIVASGATAIIAEGVTRIADSSINPMVKKYHWGDFTKAIFEAKGKHVETANLTDANGFVTEGPGFNIFAITINTKFIQKILSKVYSKVCISEITTPRCLERLAKRKPDLIFSGVKYFEFNGAHIWLNDFLELHKICYIGSNHAALDCEHDKGLANSTIKEAGVVTANYVAMKANSFQTRKAVNMAYPVFVKPVIGCDSIGINNLSVVFNPEHLGAKIKQIFNVLNCDALVESYLAGREFSVGILKDEKSGVLTAISIEIIAPKNNRGHRVLDFGIRGLDREHVRQVKNKTLHIKLSEAGKFAFTALSGRSFGRIGIKLCAAGIPHFIEANLMPGLSKGFFCRFCAINLGITYDEMILLLSRNWLNSHIMSSAI